MVFHWIDFDLGILFQSIKTFGTYIFFSLDFIFGFMWKWMDACVFIIYYIAISCLISLLVRYFMFNYKAITIFCSCWRRSVGVIATFPLNFFLLLLVVLRNPRYFFQVLFLIKLGDPNFFLFNLKSGITISF